MIGRKITFAGKKFCVKLKDLTEVEKDFLISLEFDNEVATYFPAKMETQISGKPEEFLKMHYWVVYENKFERIFHIYEGRFSHEVWNKVLTSLKDIQVSFQPVSKKSIEQEPRRSNLRILWEHAYLEELKIAYLWDLREFFVAQKIPKVGKLKKFLLARGYSEELVYMLIFHRALICDLDNHELNNETIILLNPCLELGSKWKREIQENGFF